MLSKLPLGNAGRPGQIAMGVRLAHRSSEVHVEWCMFDGGLFRSPQELATPPLPPRGTLSKHGGWQAVPSFLEWACCSCCPLQTEDWWEW